MKKPIYILMIAAALGIGAGFRFLSSPKPQPVPEQAKPQVEIAAPEEMVISVAPPPPAPETNQLAAVKVVAPEVEEPPAPKPAARMQASHERYWRQMAKNVEQQLQRLDREKNQARRAQLINQIARYVRFDTPAAIDWAMGLEDPEERRAALEAINKSALVGIGAHIEMAESGLPMIKQTTIMSAIESSGMVEPGDQIAGVVKADGSTVYFQGQSIQQIVNQLRGEAGSEIQLLMERPMVGNAAYAYAVPVQRSLIVVQPPY
jgi:C-terminal processing protease CtpA/Prc